MLLQILLTCIGCRESGPLPFRLPWRGVQYPSVPAWFCPAGKIQHAMPSQGSVLKTCPGRSFRSLFLFVIWSQLARVGEAMVPGPEFQQQVVLGTFNGGGILHKAELVASLPPGVWTTSETHLTHAGVKKFQYDLRCRGSPIRYIPGHPAPPLSDSKACMGGKCTGVGILSHHPIRAMTSGFDDALWQTGRIQVAAACLQGVWVKLGTAYGYSAAK